MKCAKMAKSSEMLWDVDPGGPKEPILDGFQNPDPQSPHVNEQV